jgi:tRNA nucleotidyltransferase (CCA-adding enzyme)
MRKTSNLADRITRQLPGELVDIMQFAGSVAGDQSQRLFLVGGVVRDLLLYRHNLDLDLVAECDAIQLAEALVKLKGGKMIAHSRFNTAKIQWGKWSVDFATARAESYEKPGALPSVQCKCEIKDDLRRRDFTINAMAVYLDPLHFGELIDLHGGVQDLEKGIIRILHDDSFRDDATRIWRAVRYEQRMNFRIEQHTLRILKRDIDYLDTISNDRIRHELELCLEEDKPERALMRADKLGILTKICPALEADEWMVKKFAKARGMLQPYCPPLELYLAFLVYRLPFKVFEDLVAYFKFSRSLAQTLRDTLNLKNELSCLTGPQPRPSVIYRCLHRFSQNAILANMIASELPIVNQRIELYLNKLRYVRTALSGEDLINLKVESGPRIREILEDLRLARLDGKISNKEEEIALVKQGLSLQGESLQRN